MSKYEGFTEARKKANIKYFSEKVEEIKVRVPKGKKAEYMAKAKSKNLSLNAYIISLIESDN